MHGCDVLNKKGERSPYVLSEHTPDPAHGAAQTKLNFWVELIRHLSGFVVNPLHVHV